MKPPTVPDSFPDLQQRSLEELEKIRDDEATFQAYLQQQPQVNETTSLLNDLSREVENIARARAPSCAPRRVRARVQRLTAPRSGKNLEQEPKLRQALAQLAAAHEQLAQVRRSYEGHLQRQQSLMQQLTADAVLSQLRVAAAEADEESEALIEQLARKELTAEDFVQKYVQARQLYHQRSAKTERLMAQQR